MSFVFYILLFVYRLYCLPSLQSTPCCAFHRLCYPPFVLSSVWVVNRMLYCLRFWLSTILLFCPPFVMSIIYGVHRLYSPTFMLSTVCAVYYLNCLSFALSTVYAVHRLCCMLFELSIVWNVNQWNALSLAPSYPFFVDLTFVLLTI